MAQVANNPKILSAPLAPPRARRIAHPVVGPQGSREDPYYWLRDDSRSDPRVLEYLRAENAYFTAGKASWASLEDRLFDEIVARIRQDDASVPVFENGYWYYARYETGREYPIYARRRERDQGVEEILLDGNALATGHEYYEIGNYEVSEDNRLLAWAEDCVGRREYVVRMRDLATGEEHEDRLTGVESDLAFADDPRVLLYVAKDPVTLLGNRVMVHTLGTSQSADRLLYEQLDESCYTSVYRSRSRKLLYLVAQGTLTSEYRYARAADPALTLQLLLAREPGHEYHVEDLAGRFLIRSNWQAPDFRLCEAPIEAAADRANWRVLVPQRSGVFLDDFQAFTGHLALSERIGGVRRIRVRDWAGGEERLLPAEEPASSLWLGDNPSQDSRVLRYVYSALTTPATTYDFDLVSGERVLLKREPLAVPYDERDYRTELIWVAARDGARVPVTLMMRRDFVKDGRAALYQYAYGAYGLCLDPGFSSARLSLVDRGVVYATAHVRGGQELGRAWYDGGRLHHKLNSFTDYIDVTRALVAGGYCAADRVFGAGGSAGGLLIGAVANLAGTEYRGLVAHVPFVDVVTTMLDESIPLTTNEYEEWGDPRVAADYDYMLGYSPYDNAGRRAYPAMLVTTGLYDSQVQYWEPAKWVARLRELKLDSQPLFLRVNLEAGHGGKSGRFKRYREVAEEYAFILDLAGLK